MPTENTNDVWMQQGLSFACYTPSLIAAKDFLSQNKHRKQHFSTSPAGRKRTENGRELGSLHSTR